MALQQTGDLWKLAPLASVDLRPQLNSRVRLSQSFGVQKVSKLPSTHGDVYAAVLSAYEDEYKDLVESWRSLETKAQGTGAIAGVFLAAGATLSKTLLTTAPIWIRLAFAPSFVLVILAIAYSVRGLRVKVVARRPEGSSIERLAQPVLRTPEVALKESGKKFIQDQLEAWRKTNHEFDETVKTKAAAVSRAQALLAWAAFTFAIYSIIAIVHS